MLGLSGLAAQTGGRGDMRKRRTSSDTKTAYHESGHALVSFLMKRGVREVTIIPADEFLGLCKNSSLGKRAIAMLECGFDGEGRRRTTARRCIMTSQAGPIAEEIACGKHRHWNRGCYQDFYKIADMASYIQPEPDESGALIDSLWEETRKLLLAPENWAAVEALTAELLVHRRLGQKRVREIIKGALGRPLQSVATQAEGRNDYEEG